jgi:hypothetical protein
MQQARQNREVLTYAADKEDDDHREGRVNEQKHGSHVSALPWRTFSDAIAVVRGHHLIVSSKALSSIEADWSEQNVDDAACCCERWQSSRERRPVLACALTCKSKGHPEHPGN